MYCYSPLAYALAVMAVAGVIRSWSLLSRAKALAQTVADFCLTSSARVALVLGRFQRLQRVLQCQTVTVPVVPDVVVRGSVVASDDADDAERERESYTFHFPPALFPATVTPAVDDEVDDDDGDVDDNDDDDDDGDDDDDVGLGRPAVCLSRSARVALVLGRFRRPTSA